MPEDKAATIHPPISPEVITRKSPHFRAVYSNQFRYRVSPTDVSLVFLSAADTGEQPVPWTLTEEVIVLMSLGQAKALSEYLTMIVNRYERELGPILALGKSPPTEQELDRMFSILKGIGVH
jgi:Protein of unknown function (DUF3467)